jgi:hypothetical protein
MKPIKHKLVQDRLMTGEDLYFWRKAVGDRTMYKK